MKLGFIEVCYIEPVKSVMANGISAEWVSNSLKLLSMFIDKIAVIGFKIFICIIVIKILQCIISIIKNDGDINLHLAKLKRYSVGATLLYIVPYSVQICNSIVDTIFR